MASTSVAASSPATTDYTAGFEDYEKITLASNDGHLFIMPKMHLIIYSMAFRDMFASCTNDETPLKLEESTAVLRAILGTMVQKDPAQDRLPGTKGFPISEVVKACGKYQMPDIALLVFSRVLCVMFAV